VAAPNDWSLERYRPLLRLQARQLQLDPRLKQEWDSSDIVQDAYCRAIAKRDQFRGTTEGELICWLQQILANAVKDKIDAASAGKRNIAKVRSLEEAVTESHVRLDAFLAATGAWTPFLNRALGRRVPIQPGKGYSLAMGWPAISPTIPLHVEEHRVGVTPFQTGYRLGSTMEFAGYDTTIKPRRLAPPSPAASWSQALPPPARRRADRGRMVRLATHDAQQPPRDRPQRRLRQRPGQSVFGVSSGKVLAGRRPWQLRDIGASPPRKAERILVA
jgi:Sigma-70 region 2/FAD dependent oxidoreductase